MHSRVRRNLVMMIIICAGVYFVVSDEWALKLRTDKNYHDQLSRKIAKLELSLKRIEATLNGTQPATSVETDVVKPAGSVLTTDGDAATTATATSGEGLTKRR